MRDLEKFYHAATMYFVFEEVCLGLDDISLSAYKDGRHFSGIPFMEKYKGKIEKMEHIDNDPDDFDIVEEMKLGAAASKKEIAHDYFVSPPFEYIDELQQILIDIVKFLKRKRRLYNGK